METDLERRWKAVFGVLVFNLVLFILVTSSSTFEELHHHWIFLTLAVPLTIQWGLTFAVPPGRKPAFFSIEAARACILSILAFLIFMGVVRHATILACIGRCSFKLGPAALVAAIVFTAQSRSPDLGFWCRARSETVGLACLVWAAYLALFGLHIPTGRLDIIFLAAAAVIAGLGWKRPSTRIVGLTIPIVLLVRRFFGERPIIGLDLVIVSLALAAVRRLSPRAP